MSDELANYENTKRTAPVPAGWMLTEPQNVDPRSTVLQFWNPIDQCWLELKLDPQGNPCEEFVKLWTGGATCCIVRDPNYVAPPPPPTFTTPFATPFATPAAPAVPVFAPPQAPAIPAPVATPVVPVIPVAAPILPVIPAPLPVVPASLPVPEVATAPSNVLPFPVAPAPTMSKSLPVVETFEVEEEIAQASGADPNEVAAWLAARDGVKAQIDALEAVEKELQAKIVKTCFPDGLREGSNNCSLPDGRVLNITGVVNRTVDDAMVPAALDALQKHFGVAPAGLFRTKYEVGAKVFKGLDSDAKKLLANVVTEKQGSPQLKIKELKA